MKNHHIIVFFFSLFLIMRLGSFVSCTEESKVYIVYLGEHNGDKTLKEIEDHHCSFLHSVKGTTTSKEDVRASLVHSYKNVINGFSAVLTPQEVDMISGMEGVVSVFHSDPYEIRPHTTRSWDFVSLLEGTSLLNSREELLQNASYGKDIIVGVMDSGVWPESLSFNDEGMEPVPKSWKGICQEGVAFNASHCNRKLIGARYYLKGYEAAAGPLNETRDFRSPRDVDGHGTHTAGTVGGRRVANASAIGGFAKGTATGGAPNVRLAIYKVCWPVPDQSLAEGNACATDDILAAFDDAIADGVHVLSISLGSLPKSTYYTENAIAIGSLHAVKKNIVVSCSAGNDGPTPSTVGNVAPWVITVGASSIDRVFSSPIMLGNGMIVEGQTVTPIRRRRLHPLVYAGDVEIRGTTASNTTGTCLPGTLSRNLVRGKVVLCINNLREASMEVKRAGGVAAILGNRFNEIQVTPFLDPTTVVFSYSLNTLLTYIRTEKNPMATLVPGNTLIGSKLAPVMASFTSKGPNVVDPNILKPDITAPGFNILAAWSEASSPLKMPEDRRVVKYNIVSGTSMSCPHVSGVIALLKSIHPDWSSAAIRSALMTTSTINNVVGRPIKNATGDDANPFEYGSGHFRPSRAVDPGLVYDATYTDYLLYLCSQNISLDLSFSCPEKVPTASNLNYPSLAIANMRGSIRTVTRVVTNVGKDNSTYVLGVRSPPGYVVDIVPKSLHFSKLGEKHSFNITIIRAQNSVERRNEFSFGWYTWSDGVHVVRSPIAVSSTPNNSNSDLKLQIIPTRQFERTIELLELLLRSYLSNHHNSTPAATSSTQFLSPANSLRAVSTEKWNSSKLGIIGPSVDPYLVKYEIWLHNQVYSAIRHYPSFLQKLNCCARMGGSLQFHFFSCNILLKGINSTGLSDKLNVTSALKHSKKQGELSLTISDAADQKKVQKAGKVEHHLWKKRESAGSGQKALNLVRIISGLPNEKESVYGALDKWIAWEAEFPLIAAAKALRILRQQRLWKRVIQVAKWMLSKGQGATMATYDALLLAFDMDNRVDEAETLWNMILHTSTRSVSKRLFSRMISLYDHHHVPDKIVEVFADMEELGVKPDEDTVRRVARAFQMLGQEDKQKLVLKKYQSRWKYVHFNGERARVRREME